MFRLSHYVKQLYHPTPLPPEKPDGPVVVWHITRNSNLLCAGNYALSDNRLPGELTTAQALSVVNDLARLGVPLLIFTGGEPLMRNDIFEIASHAGQKGMKTRLITNGTLIGPEDAERIHQAGFEHVEVCIEGIGETHDVARGHAGAYDAALRGLRFCRNQGLRTGIRYALCETNRDELNDLLDLAEREELNTFYMLHLDQVSRGNIHRHEDIMHAATRSIMETLLDEALYLASKGIDREIVTGNNDADAAWFLLWVREHMPHHFTEIWKQLARWGGNATGRLIASIDSEGVVHPDSMWWTHSLGSVKVKPFSKIWRATDDAFMAALRQSPRPLKGRCGACPCLPVCNGNTRTRALEATGDPWTEDPGCYINDRELSLLRRMPREEHHAPFYH